MPTQQSFFGHGCLDNIGRNRYQNKRKRKKKGDTESTRTISILKICLQPFLWQFIWTSNKNKTLMTLSPDHWSAQNTPITIKILVNNLVNMRTIKKLDKLLVNNFVNMKVRPIFKQEKLEFRWWSWKLALLNLREFFQASIRIIIWNLGEKAFPMEAYCRILYCGWFLFIDMMDSWICAAFVSSGKEISQVSRAKEQSTRVWQLKEVLLNRLYITGSTYTQRQLTYWLGYQKKWSISKYWREMPQWELLIPNSHNKWGWWMMKPGIDGKASCWTRIMLWVAYL